MLTFSNVLEVIVRVVKQEKEMKSTRIGKEETKLSLFANVEIPKLSLSQFLGLRVWQDVYI